MKGCRHVVAVISCIYTVSIIAAGSSSIEVLALDSPYSTAAPVYYSSCTLHPSTLSLHPSLSLGPRGIERELDIAPFFTINQFSPLLFLAIGRKLFQSLPWKAQTAASMGDIPVADGTGTPFRSLTTEERWRTHDKSGMSSRYEGIG